jgi:hypothetical protein
MTTKMMSHPQSAITASIRSSQRPCCLLYELVFWCSPAVSLILAKRSRAPTSSTAAAAKRTRLSGLSCQPSSQCSLSSHKCRAAEPIKMLESELEEKIVTPTEGSVAVTLANAVGAARLSLHHVVVRHEAPHDTRDRGQGVIGSSKVKDHRVSRYMDVIQVPKLPWSCGSLCRYLSRRSVQIESLARAPLQAHVLQHQTKFSR